VRFTTSINLIFGLQIYIFFYESTGYVIKYFCKFTDKMQNTKKLVTQINIQVSYLDQLVKQIDKDIRLAGIESDEFIDIDSPEILAETLYHFIDVLIHKHQESFNNFMYRVDIQEKDIYGLQQQNLEDLIENICLLIIKRELQKIYFRNKFSK